MNQYDDTIIASATAPGQSAVAVLRISGSAAHTVFTSIFRPRAKRLRPRMLAYGDVIDGDDIIDDALAVYFQAPASYTGEPSAEIHVHGSQVSVARTLNAALKAGARLAQPGEFTKRAFLNGKLDLSKAEAVMDVIAAQSAGAHRLAQQQLRGRLYRTIHSIQQDMKEMLARIGVTVDYPEEDVEEQTGEYCLEYMGRTQRRLSDLLRGAQAGALLRDGVRCAIVGLPNAGKSSLLNALCGNERAIVTDIAGTTRDTLEAHVDVDGLAVLLVDTAGIRQSDDTVERMGVERAYRAWDEAQLVLAVIDAGQPLHEETRQLLERMRATRGIVVRNKCDLPQTVTHEQLLALSGGPVVDISATTGDGLDALRRQIYTLCIGDIAPESVEISNQRHIQAVMDAQQALTQAQEALLAGFTPDTAAVDLQRAWQCLGQVTGETAVDEVVDTIFSKFCLGK
ncbi:MAG: tRNA uridine-5-carboxymethylaminomethyl(34) synthesis GTPase MnmE [Eubacteriales bacterium]|nr:tRNA uridine-5-carboxymethylaminomethyl(34) synthesis GTPase MnmE [Eubacteriales bacterium]